MSLTIIRPGLFSLVVDGGRPHSRSLGMPLGGAADRAALAFGNGLVGNGPDLAALEFTLVGPTIEVHDSTALVIFGAPFSIKVNGNEQSVGFTFTAPAQSLVEIGGTAIGARAYCCVAGGFDTPEILGSRSSLEPLSAGTLLPCRESHCTPHGLPFSSFPILAGSDPRVIRVVNGPQTDWFENESFYQQTYVVSAASNRMGVRLSGAPIKRRTGELASEAVAPGAIQIANDGQPIILGVDGQTIGGYPKIAHVIRADLDLLAQIRPGSRIRFEHIDWQESEEAARARSKELAHWLSCLRVAERLPQFEVSW